MVLEQQEKSAALLHTKMLHFPNLYFNIWRWPREQWEEHQLSLWRTRLATAKFIILHNRSRSDSPYSFNILENERIQRTTHLCIFICG
jgi:hypothetical protein